MPPPVRPASSRSAVSRRFGSYFLGLAIGLVLVGFLLSVRQLMLGDQEQTSGETQAP